MLRPTIEPQELERLVSALAEIRRLYHKDKNGLLSQEYIDPEVVKSPQEAFYAKKKSVPITESAGLVCSEFVMCYPPGIPILAPGEKITSEIIDYISYAKEKGCSLSGTQDINVDFLQVLADVLYILYVVDVYPECAFENAVVALNVHQRTHLYLCFPIYGKGDYFLV